MALCTKQLSLKWMIHKTLNCPLLPRSSIEWVNIRKTFQPLCNKSKLRGEQRFYATKIETNELPPPAKFIKLSEGTADDFKAAQEHFSRVASTTNTVDRWINMIEVLIVST